MHTANFASVLPANIYINATTQPMNKCMLTNTTTTRRIINTKTQAKTTKSKLTTMLTPTTKARTATATTMTKPETTLLTFTTGNTTNYRNSGRQRRMMRCQCQRQYEAPPPSQQKQQHDEKQRQQRYIRQQQAKHLTPHHVTVATMHTEPQQQQHQQQHRNVAIVQYIRTPKQKSADGCTATNTTTKRKQETTTTTRTTRTRRRTRISPCVRNFRCVAITLLTTLLWHATFLTAVATTMAYNNDDVSTSSSSSSSSSSRLLNLHANNNNNNNNNNNYNNIYNSSSYNYTYSYSNLNTNNSNTSSSGSGSKNNNNNNNDSASNNNNNNKNNISTTDFAILVDMATPAITNAVGYATAPSTSSSSSPSASSASSSSSASSPSSSSSSSSTSDQQHSIGDAGVISFNNDSDDLADDEAEAASEYIFDRTDVRIIFITLYTLVFCCCFFGNLLVILVVTLSRRLRSITNFFLANLALADFCVGLFCVMQNLSIYLIDSWVFGEFLCRMYQFVHSLSYTASIFILVVICMERYFAIVHPITCKQILTAARLRMVILTVWITSAVYSTPKFVFSKTIKNIHTEDGQEEEICVLDRKMFNSKLLDMINFVLLYVIPLLVMTVLYSKIAIALWRSSRGLSPHGAAHYQQQQGQQSVQAQSQQGQQLAESGMGMHNSMYHHHHQHQHHHHAHNHHLPHAHPHVHHQLQQPQAASTPTPGAPISVGSTGGISLSRKQSSKYEKRGVSISESKVSLEADRPIVTACRKTSFYQHSHSHGRRAGSGTGSSGTVGSGVSSHMSHSSNNVLRARRGVVRMLIIFVLTFALCNLPYHARKMWQYWSRSYRGDSNFNALLTPLTFLVTYFNSGVNPLLYAFLSRNFRKGMKELLLCSWKKGKSKSSSNSSMHHKRKALQTHSLPTDTTHIGNEQL